MKSRKALSLVPFRLFLVNRYKAMQVRPVWVVLWPSHREPRGTGKLFFTHHNRYVQSQAVLCWKLLLISSVVNGWHGWRTGCSGWVTHCCYWRGSSRFRSLSVCDFYSWYTKWLGTVIKLTQLCGEYIERLCRGCSRTRWESVGKCVFELHEFCVRR